jgi:hypothetical protein
MTFPNNSAAWIGRRMDGSAVTQGHMFIQWMFLEFLDLLPTPTYLNFYINVFYLKKIGICYFSGAWKIAFVHETAVSPKMKI